ncbi:hypothetical protein [Pseudomonas sp. WS 5079]|uniref:hypothetical protein n=1 Tax=Pseudomonas sp. WS 5079 TaxID=2717492 RepID=UPI001556F931|nr:hypothetical protein [Pseudomonas sp. WS 5079]NMX65527.1 hypothetical protein [Pseudomonas sp. WS 5079]
MEREETGGAAFPQSGFGQWAPECGLTLRDYFAAKAMQAMLTRDCPVCTKGMAKDAYIYADAMLAARSA